MAKNSGPARIIHERTTGEEREKMIEVTKADIIKKFGDGAIMRYGDGGPELEVEAIPTGAIALDAALGIGGVPRGRIIEIYGPESSGKTTLSLEIVAEAQAMGGVAAFIDAEHALDPTYAARIGVDIDEVLISQPDTGEQALEICDMLVRSGAIDVVVIDSVAALVPRAEIEGEIGETTVGLQARLMSQALRKLAGSLAKSNTTCIFINQLREKIGVMFGNPETTTGGRSQVLLFRPHRHPSNREHQGQGRDRGQPRARQGCEEQGCRSVQDCGIRHHVRYGHLQGRLGARHGRPVQFRHQGRRLVHV